VDELIKALKDISDGALENDKALLTLIQAIIERLERLEDFVYGTQVH
jgi:hypothetical protein